MDVALRESSGEEAGERERERGGAADHRQRPVADHIRQPPQRARASHRWFVMRRHMRASRRARAAFTYDQALALRVAERARVATCRVPRDMTWRCPMSLSWTRRSDAPRAERLGRDFIVSISTRCSTCAARGRYAPGPAVTSRVAPTHPRARAAVPLPVGRHGRRGAILL
jgi:hypothetical protein